MSANTEKTRHLLDRVVTFCARARLRVYLYGEAMKRASEGKGLPEDVTLVMPKPDYAHFEKTARNAFECRAETDRMIVCSGDTRLTVLIADPLPNRGLRQKWYLKHPSGKVDDRAAHYCLVDGKVFPIELFRGGTRIEFVGLDVRLPSGYATILKEEGTK